MCIATHTISRQTSPAYVGFFVFPCFAGRVGLLPDERRAARSMQAAGCSETNGADAPGVLQLIPKTQEEKSVRAATLSLTI